MTPILYEQNETQFNTYGLGALSDLYDVEVVEVKNDELTMTASYPSTGVRYGDIKVGRLIAVKPSPVDAVHAFRIVNTVANVFENAINIEAESITYDLNANLVTKVNVTKVNGAGFMTALTKNLLTKSNITFYSDVPTVSSTNLEWLSPLEMLVGTTGSFLQFWGGEQKRENNKVSMLKRRGHDNVATYRLGKNITGLKYSTDITGLITAVIPTATIGSEDTSTTYTGSVVYSQYRGNYPVTYFSHVDVTENAGVVDEDTSAQAIAKINAYAGNWFSKSENAGTDLPVVTVEMDVESIQDSSEYGSKFKHLEDVGLFDTVTVFIPEYRVNINAMVNELHYDPLNEKVTQLVIGATKKTLSQEIANSEKNVGDVIADILAVKTTASTALDTAKSTTDLANSALANAAQAQQDANNAYAAAQVAHDGATQATQAATDANKAAIDATLSAVQANKTANDTASALADTKKSANDAYSMANQAQQSAKDAQTAANKAQSSVDDANDALKSTLNDVKIAQQTADTAKTQAENNKVVAQNALDVANNLTELTGKIQQSFDDTVNGLGTYQVNILSSAPTVFKNNEGSTVLSAQVWHNGNDITGTLNVNAFHWTRVSNVPADDEAWNDNHASGTKTIQITALDFFQQAQFDVFVDIDN